MEKPFYTGGYEQAKLCQNQQILEHVQAINLSVQQNNSELKAYALSVEKKIKELEKKKKRSLKSLFIACQNNGGIFLISSYDNGDNEGEPLTSSVIGDWKICRLKFSKSEQKRKKFAIVFPCNKVYVIGDLNKNSKAGLYDYFIKAQIIFNPLIDQKKIKEALYTTFAPLIENSRNTLEIPELAGWYRERFLYSENFPFAQRSGLPELPILNKSFSNIENNTPLSRDYFHLIRKIRCWQNRIILMELPIIGMLSSLFAQEGLAIPFFINFVFLEDFTYNTLPRFVQIFNRDTSEIIQTDATEKALTKALLQINDEVLILDAFKQDQGSYRSKKIENNLHKIIGKVVDGKTSYDIQRDIHAMVMVMSDFTIYGGKALNIFVTKNFMDNANDPSNPFQQQVIENYLGRFIIYAQNNLKSIIDIIKDHKSKILDRRIAVLEIGFEILYRFCKTEGYDMITETRSFNKIDFSSFFDEYLDSDDLKEIFVKIIRKQMGNFLIYEKTDPNAKNIYSCLYNAEYLWIPPVTLNIMLKNSGLGFQKSAILSELKTSGDLKTDIEGLTRKLQINGKRSEFYQFKRSLFNTFGMTDIVNLGKEKI